MTEFRTPPLWGVSQTGPWLHDGSAQTFAAAIEGHDGEATGVVEAWRMLDDSEKVSLNAFLESL